MYKVNCNGKVVSVDVQSGGLVLPKNRSIKCYALQYNTVVSSVYPCRYTGPGHQAAVWSPIHVCVLMHVMLDCTLTQGRTERLAVCSNKL